MHASDHVKLYIIMCPVGPYYKTRDPVKLYADTTNVRAWPGGVGNAKVTKSIHRKNDLLAQTSMGFLRTVAVVAQILICFSLNLYVFD